MRACWLALVAATLLAPCVAADQVYTVWGSVVYNRIGEQTPALLGGDPILTPTGARQAYSAGSFFRSRYITATNGSIRGMNLNLLDPNELYVLALDLQPSAASAQAFVQGLYPPVTLNTSAMTLLDPNSVTSAFGYVSLPSRCFTAAH